MPKSKPDRKKEYEKLKANFEKEGRYQGREKEVAARIVNKQRREYGESKQAKAEQAKNKRSSQGLPIQGYEHMTISEVLKEIPRLDKKEIAKIKRYEEKHKDRKTLLRHLEKRVS